MPSECPLCRGPRHRIETLDVAGLIAAYRRQFRVDTARYFEGIKELSLLRCSRCGLEGFDPPIAGDAEFYQGMSAWWDTQMPGHGAIEQKPTYKRALQYIKAGDKLLEVGAGSLILAHQLPPPTKYVGLELDPRSIKQAQRMGLDVRPESIEIHSKFNSACYDLVCHFQVIEHVPAPHSFIESCLTCLKPGGRMIIACPNNKSFLAVEPDNILNMPPHHVTWFSRRPLEWISEHWSLRVVEIIEEPLEPGDRRAFAKQIWLQALGRFWRTPERFTLGGSGFRVASLLSRAMARTTAPLLANVAFAIPGHTIMAVYQKPIAAKEEAAFATALDARH